jgi:uncharacterized protein YabN with tetrapyrrole methylase and pyrophosphatase domain
MGDVLFAAVNLARWLGVEAESALRQGNARFRRRLARMETAARQAGRSLGDLNADELDQLWEAAKRA